MADVGIEILRSGHFSDYPNHFMARDRPDDCLLIWVMAGAGWSRIEGRHVYARAGTLLTFVAGQSHAYGSSNTRPWDIVWAHFIGSKASEWVRELRRIGGGVAPQIGVSERLRQRFLELVEVHGARTSESRELATPLLVAIFGLIRHQLRLPTASAVEHHDTIERLCAFVRDHLAEPITVDRMAAHAHVSRRQLTRLMRQALGQAPMDYVTRQRLGRATTLLAETALPIANVAQRVGYADPYYFSRLFHRRMKLSPTAYRAKHRPALPPIHFRRDAPTIQ